MKHPGVAKVIVAAGPEHEMLARVFVDKQSLVSHMKQYVRRREHCSKIDSGHD